jgi:hypothetical protein
MMGCTQIVKKRTIQIKCTCHHQSRGNKSNGFVKDVATHAVRLSMPQLLHAISQRDVSGCQHKPGASPLQPGDIMGTSSTFKQHTFRPLCDGCSGASYEPCCCLWQVDFHFPARIMGSICQLPYEQSLVSLTTCTTTAKRL